MHVQLNIPEPLYAEIAQAAAASGQTVEAMVVDQLAIDFSDTPPASFWTPDILASIDAAFEEGDRLGGLTLDQVQAKRLAKSKAWRATHSA